MKYKALRLATLVPLLFMAASMVTGIAWADTVNVAVASNFAPLMEVIKAEFERSSPHRIMLIKGSSGKHFAQISNGAPYELFLSADSERVELLRKQKDINPDYSKTYAIGRLALWSAGDSLPLSEELLSKPENYSRLAIANPKLAPYGKAAMEAIEHYGLSDEIDHKLVYGENVAQAFQFAYSGSAQLAFVAYSQVLNSIEIGSYWLIPESIYTEIKQDMILLKGSAGAHSLFDFMLSDTVRQIISLNGYLPPQLTQSPQEEAVSQ